MTYTIETRRTVDGRRYYIRADGKLISGGFASQAAAANHIKALEVLKKAEAELKAQIRYLRQERSA